MECQFSSKINCDGGCLPVLSKIVRLIDFELPVVSDCIANRDQRGSDGDTRTFAMESNSSTGRGIVYQPRGVT